MNWFMDGPKGSTKHVLIAEDDPNDLLLLERAARGAPKTVAFQFVRDGEELMNYLKGEGQFADRAAFPFPDLLLLDMHLPKLTGIQILRWIRANQKWAALKIFAWSGSEYEGDFARAKEAGADDAMPRPRSFDELQALMRKFAEDILAEEKSNAKQG